VIYLASPYAHINPEIMEERFQLVCEAAAIIMRNKLACYSPIAHNHPIAVAHKLPRTWDFWQLMDLPLLTRATQLWVLKLDGWNESKGIEAEVAFARAAGIPVSWITLKDLKAGFNG
jgi:hypothetical protein